MERADAYVFWRWSSRGWLHWKIQVWLHSSMECCPTLNPISWRLWLFFLRGNCECQSDRWWRRCYFTTPYFCMHRHCTKYVCTAKQQRQPWCFSYSWERVDALCLQTFLVITDKRGRSVWVDSLQAGSYGRLLYILPSVTTQNEPNVSKARVVSTWQM